MRLFQSRFLWALYAGYTALILITAGIIGVTVAHRIQRDTLDEIEHGLGAESLLLHDMAVDVFRASTHGDTQARIVELGRAVGTRFTFIRADGTVIADSDKDPALLDDHGQRPEVLEARARGRGISRRHSDSIGVWMMYLATPVVEEGELLGYVRASVPLTSVDRSIHNLRSLVTVAVLIAVGFALVVGYLLARRTLRPISIMADRMEALAAGDDAQRVPIRRDDELGTMALAFNTLADRLQLRMETISKDRNKLRAVLGSMFEGVVAVDREEKIVHINKVAANLLQAPDGGEGRHIWEITRTTEICEAMTRSINTGLPVAGECRQTHPADDTVVEYRVTPLRADDDDSTGAVVVLNDVSDLRRLETIRRDFVHNVSRDLESPITAMRELLDSATEAPDETAEVRRERLDRIRDESTRLALLVSDLLVLCKLETRSSTAELQALDLCEIAQQALSDPELTRSIAARKLNMGHSLPTAPVMVIGDRAALGRAIGSLLDNAVRYTPAGGRVGLQVRVEEDEAVIEVEDTGTGIEPRHRDRIFERFYRAEQARALAPSGAGLGLSIVKHAALVHGGRVGVESTPGAGSTFRLWIPLATSGNEEKRQ